MENPTVESVRRFLKDFGSDGWSILEPDGLVKGYGFPAEWVARLVYNHKSQGGKFDITSDKTGKVVKSMKGVHTLDVLARLDDVFDAKAERRFFGRGSQARAYTEAILKVIG
jgi:hypothetical protein